MARVRARVRVRVWVRVWVRVRVRVWVRVWVRVRVRVRVRELEHAPGRLAALAALAARRCDGSVGDRAGDCRGEDEGATDRDGISQVAPEQPRPYLGLPPG